jgi:hypothetical protein
MIEVFPNVNGVIFLVWHVVILTELPVQSAKKIESSKSKFPTIYRFVCVNKDITRKMKHAKVVQVPV